MLPCAANQAYLRWKVLLARVAWSVSSVHSHRTLLRKSQRSACVCPFSTTCAPAPARLSSVPFTHPPRSVDRSCHSTSLCYCLSLGLSILSHSQLKPSLLVRIWNHTRTVNCASHSLLRSHAHWTLIPSSSQPCQHQPKADLCEQDDYAFASILPALSLQDSLV